MQAIVCPVGRCLHKACEHMQGLEDVFSSCLARVFDELGDKDVKEKCTTHAEKRRDEDEEHDRKEAVELYYSGYHQGRDDDSRTANSPQQDSIPDIPLKRGTDDG